MRDFGEISVYGENNSDSGGVITSPLLSFYKEVFYTIWVSKEEAEVLRSKIKGVHITKTMRKGGSSRGKRYAEPTAPVIKILKELRDVDYIEV